MKVQSNTNSVCLVLGLMPMACQATAFYDSPNIDQSFQTLEQVQGFLDLHVHGRNAGCRSASSLGTA